jgi:ribosome-associated protein
MIEKDKKILDRIAQAIFDKKGMNILALDVRGASANTDHVIIAEGLAERHVTALGETIIKTLEEEGVSLSFQQGMNSGDWVVLDYFTIVIHLFMPGMRDKYDLERLWPESDIVDVVIDYSSKSAHNQGLDERYWGETRLAFS